MDDLSLKQFTSMDAAPNVKPYVKALEAFDAIPGLQELKALARDQGGVAPGRRILDVGCGFGLETLRLARLAGPSGRVAGIDKSADFIADASARAKAEGLAIDFRTGDADALPWPDASFDCVRAERLLIYLKDPALAVREMLRVLRPGGGLALIEPDYSTTTVNLPDRPALRRALAHEADTAVLQSWLPGPLAGILADLGLAGIARASRVLVFPQDLGATYFTAVGRHAADAGALDAAELAAWTDDIAALRARGRLFGTVGYFLFTATRPPASNEPTSGGSG
jgi:SAM-dependent methyltransferase